MGPDPPPRSNRAARHRRLPIGDPQPNHRRLASAPLLQLRVPLAAVTAAVQDRLTGQHHGAVVWSRHDSELLVDPRAVKLRATAGFLVAELGVESQETGPVVARLVVYLGTPTAGAGLAVAATHDASTPAVLADAWGDALRGVVWEGLLDVVEGATVAASQAAGAPLAVLGLTGAEDAVLIAVGPCAAPGGFAP